MRYHSANDDAQIHAIRLATALECLDESLTIQGAPDADINELMKRMGVTDGSILPATLGVTDPRFYGDFSDIPDLREALDRTSRARELFDNLPAKIRTRFQNDPWELHNWINQPDNVDEAVTLGLLKRMPSETQAPPIVSHDTPTPEPKP